jgi:hypothetical protein
MSNVSGVENYLYSVFYLNLDKTVTPLTAFLSTEHCLMEIVYIYKKHVFQSGTWYALEKCYFSLELFDRYK